MPYRSLNPHKIQETLETLNARIAERFPGSGLAKVCAELVQIAAVSRERVEHLAQPHLPLRIASTVVTITGISVLVYVATIIEYKRETENLFGVLEGIDALLNTVVLMGAGLFFLATLESRWKRQRALDDLHQLRSIVHVIDMHQLTKDPRVLTDGERTKSSPERRVAVDAMDALSETLAHRNKSMFASRAASLALGPRLPSGDLPSVRDKSSTRIEGLVVFLLSATLGRLGASTGTKCRRRNTRGMAERSL